VGGSPNDFYFPKFLSLVFESGQNLYMSDWRKPYFKSISHDIEKVLNNVSPTVRFSTRISSFMWLLLTQFSFLRKVYSCN
jgi:hypothetical protein